MFVCFNGRFVKAPEAKVSILDHGFLYGDGIYETLRTYNGAVWELQEHLDRLEKSAQYVSLGLPYSKKKIASWTEKLVKKNGFPESRIRITVTRGQNGFDFLTSPTPTLLIQAVKLEPQPASVYKQGVKAVTVRYERTMPRVKSISLFPLVLAQQEVKRKKAYEGIIVDHKGFVREGTITNLFLVKNGILYTPKSKILLGTTRAMILKLARKLGMKVRIQDFTSRKLFSADELFLTNAPRGIIPVRQVDGRKIGTGRPGTYTRQLIQSFHDYTQKYSR